MIDPRPRTDQFRRISLKRLMILVVVAGLICGYVASYYRLSRRGLAEARRDGMDGFVYVPFAETATPEGINRHYEMMWLYAPIHWVDHKILGTPGPLVCFLRLSG